MKKCFDFMERLYDLHNLNGIFKKQQNICSLILDRRLTKALAVKWVLYFSEIALCVKAKRATPKIAVALFLVKGQFILEIR